jgi:hypothetical protein
MLARLWWKEYRVFGPAWLALGLAAALLQWLFVSVNGEDARSGALTVAALLWAVLYAFAVGAAAFAGERESNALGFLDALPVGRPTLWLGKATFAFASTFGLALLLAGLAELGIGARLPAASNRHAFALGLFGPLLFEAVAWGLLWSSISKNPLVAGGMAVVSVAMVGMLSTWAIRFTDLPVSSDYLSPWMIPIRMLVATAALAVSGLAIVPRPSRAWSIGGWDAPGRPGPIEVRASSTGRSLAWQTWREGWTTGLFVALVGLTIPAGIVLAGTRGESTIFSTIFVLLAIMASLVAGVSVFGAENASGGRRFLAHHGVASGTVWRWKLLVWGAGMASFLGLLLLTLALLGSRFGDPAVTAAEGSERLLLVVVGVSNAFAVGILCGMVIFRRVTAALVGVLLLIALVPLQLGLVLRAMVPTWTLLLTPSILFAISRAWSDDWLLERQGARPWVKLACLIAVPFGLLGVSYVSYRAFGVPDVGPVVAPNSSSAEIIPAEQDAAEVDRRAIQLIRAEKDFFNDQNGRTSAPLEGVIEAGWDPKQTEVVHYWEMNREAIDLARKASAMPRARYDPPGSSPNSTGEPTARGLGLLAQLLALDTRERQSRRDPAGAWDDILAQFRMANQLGSNTPTLARMNLAIFVHHRAVGLAFDWLGDARQAPEMTRRALADLKALPPLPDLTECVRVESSIVERTLNLSEGDLADLLLPGSGGEKPSTLGLLFFARVVAPPWERERARRVCRRLLADSIPVAAVEPWRRDPTAYPMDQPISAFQSSQLARMVLPSFRVAVDRLDGETVGRRALDQAVALVAWKLGHGGDYPRTLQALVPEILDRLPIDPYSGRAFDYIRSEGQLVLPPIYHELGSPPRFRPTRPGQPLLYSVGPDRRDDGGRVIQKHKQVVTFDILFAIP